MDDSNLKMVTVASVLALVEDVAEHFSVNMGLVAESLIFTLAFVGAVFLAYGILDGQQSKQQYNLPDAVPKDDDDDDDDNWLAPCKPRWPREDG